MPSTSEIVGEMRTPDISVRLFDDNWVEQEGIASDIPHCRIMLMAVKDKPVITHLPMECWYPGFEGSHPMPVTPLMFRPSGFRFMARSSKLSGHRIQLSFSREKLSTAWNDHSELSPRELETGLLLGSTNSLVAQLLARLAMEVREPGLASSTFVDAIATAVIFEVARTIRPLRWIDDKRPIESQQVRQLREWLTDMDSPSPDVETLARMCGVSSRSLLRQFKRDTGRTLISFVREVRLAKARRLLAESRLPLKQVAYRLGYAGPSSFIESFRREAGMTPAQFRRDMARR